MKEKYGGRGEGREERAWRIKTRVDLGEGRGGEEYEEKKSLNAMVRRGRAG